MPRYDLECKECGSKASNVVMTYDEFDHRKCMVCGAGASYMQVVQDGSIRGQVFTLEIPIGDGRMIQAHSRMSAEREMSKRGLCDPDRGINHHPVDTSKPLKEDIKASLAKTARKHGIPL